MVMDALRSATVASFTFMVVICTIMIAIITPSPALASSLSWTSINIDSSSAVDLWTVSSSGCDCPFDSGRSGRNCACCVQDGGCHCGPALPSRCTQCGLEDRCDQMCNVTLDAKELWERSGKSFGQLKGELQMETSDSCWFRFQPSRDQRLELQIYRLVNVGRLLDAKCEEGSLQLQLGDLTEMEMALRTRSSNLGRFQSNYSLCGLNERFTPPVVLFTDDAEPATLLFRVQSSHHRPRFMAHFSFTPLQHESLGMQTQGGTKVNHTECDWVFQDTICLKQPGGCQVASPGYPGLYPPYANCHYHVLLSSPLTRVHVVFIESNLPPERCLLDYIAFHNGPSTNHSLISRLCGKQRIELTHAGPNLLFNFRSGPLLPPYEYNGFKAKLVFESLSENLTSPASPKAPNTRPQPPLERLTHAVCDYAFRAANGRSGHWSTASSAWKVWPAPCTIAFLGSPGDLVQLSIFNYFLSGEDCSSFVEIHDGPLDVRWNPSIPKIKLCSPDEKTTRDKTGKFGKPWTIVSTNNSMVVRFRLDPNHSLDQFLDGAFAFHYERTEGLKPSANLCDVTFDASHTDKSGTWKGIGHKDELFWNVQGSLNCNATFRPSNHQEVTVTVASLPYEDNCVTECTGTGCRCSPLSYPYDYVAIYESTSGQFLSCLCGNGTTMPFSLSSNNPLVVVQSIANYAWSKRDSFRMTMNYEFLERRIDCGPSIITTEAGSLSSKSVPSQVPAQIHYAYYYHTCLWIAEVQAGEQLSAIVSTAQQGDCLSWNMTFNLYSDGSPWKSGRTLDTVCPNKIRTMFVMPPRTPRVAVRLISMSTSPVDYRLEWQTSHTAAPTPEVQNALSPPISTPFSNSHRSNSSSNVAAPAWTCLTLLAVLMSFQFANKSLVAR